MYGAQKYTNQRHKNYIDLYKCKTWKGGEGGKLYNPCTFHTYTGVSSYINIYGGGGETLQCRLTNTKEVHHCEKMTMSFCYVLVL